MQQYKNEHEEVAEPFLQPLSVDANLRLAFRDCEEASLPDTLGVLLARLDAVDAPEETA